MQFAYLKEMNILSSLMEMLGKWLKDIQNKYMEIGIFLNNGVEESMQQFILRHIMQFTSLEEINILSSMMGML